MFNLDCFTNDFLDSPFMFGSWSVPVDSEGPCRQLVERLLLVSSCRLVVVCCLYCCRHLCYYSEPGRALPPPAGIRLTPLTCVRGYLIFVFTRVLQW